MLMHVLMTLGRSGSGWVVVQFLYLYHALFEPCWTLAVHCVPLYASQSSLAGFHCNIQGCDDFVVENVLEAVEISVGDCLVVVDFGLRNVRHVLRP